MAIDRIAAAWDDLPTSVQEAIETIVDLAKSRQPARRATPGGLISAASIADAHGLNERVVRRHLERWRQENDGTLVNTTPKARGAQVRVPYRCGRSVG